VDLISTIYYVAKSLLHRLQEERPTVLINDLHKDVQTKKQVQNVIKNILNEALPQSYDRTIYSAKCDVVFEHFLTMAQNAMYMGRA
jgi:type I restriction enzyme, R subunit